MYQKQKGLVVYSRNVRKLYLIQIKVVSLRHGSQGEKMSTALHYVLETKGITRDERKLRKNLYH
jgi:hypothetical protein